MSIGFGLETPGILAARHPVPSGLVLVLLVLSCLFAVPTLQFDESIHRVFLSDSPQSRQYNAFFERLGSKPSDIVILAEADRAFTAVDFQNIQDLTLEIAVSEGIDLVLSPFSARFPVTHPDYPGEPLLKSDLTDVEITDRLNAYTKRQASRPLIAADRHSAMIIATVENSARDSNVGKISGANTRAILTELQALASEQSGAGLQFTVTGEDAISMDIADALKVDLLTLNLVGAALVFCLSLLMFRNIRTTIVAIVPALLGTLTALALFVLLGYKITVLSNVIPVLVLVIGIADSIHLTLHFRATQSGENEIGRVVRTIQDVGPACGLTALTTAIAFMAIAISDNAQLFEFAVVGALSVMASFFVVIVTFAILARALGNKLTPSPEQKAILSVPRWLENLVFSNHRTIIFVSILLAGAGFWSYSKTAAWFPISQNLPAASELRHANDRLEKTFGGFFRVWSELDTSGANALSSPAGWNRLTRLTEAIEKAAPSYSIVSLVSVARWLDAPGRAPNEEDLEDIPEELLQHLRSPDGTRARIVIFMPEPMRDHETLATFDRLERTAMENGAKNVIGLPVVMRHGSVSIIEQLGLGLLTACLIAIFVVALAFRQKWLPLILILPNFLPLLLTAAALHILNGGQMTPTAILALTIAFGIAIDDSIHFLARTRLEQQRGASIDAALRTAIRQTGRVMIITTLLLSAGLLVTLTSAFATVQLFGLMMILTFVTALFADLLLLPALIRLRASGL